MFNYENLHLIHIEGLSAFSREVRIRKVKGKYCHRPIDQCKAHFGKMLLGAVTNGYSIKKDPYKSCFARKTFART